MKKIVHIVFNDKFTKGYIEFAKMKLNIFEHRFIIFNNGYNSNVEIQNNLYFIGSYLDTMRKREIQTALNEADEIVISGVYVKSIFWIILLLNKRWLKKTSFHFWGSDFYRYQNCRGIVQFIKKYLAVACFKRSKQLGFLIDGENEKFSMITGIRKKNSVLVVPDSPNDSPIASYRNESKNDIIRILLGNSATDTNCHKEIIDIFSSRFDLQEYELICPLSYGDDSYREYILKYGEEKIGRRFVPILEYMNKDQYMHFISHCDIGIFNNNRQQAMGNITSLLSLGKKVYLRKDTTMWENYFGKGYRIFDTDSLKTESFDMVLSFSEEDVYHNQKVGDAMNPMIGAIDQWIRFLS